MSDMSEGNGTAEGKPSAPEAKRLTRPVEEVRAELLADKDVREQARMLKIPVAEYVEKILDYATHPEKPPQIEILPDEVLKARDPSIPTVAELQTHLEKIISGEIVISPAHMPDGFSHDRTRERYTVALGTAETPKGAPDKTSASPTAQNTASKKAPSEDS